MVISPKVRKKTCHANSNLIILRVKSKIVAFIFQRSDFFFTLHAATAKTLTVFTSKSTWECSAHKGTRCSARGLPVHTARGRLPDPDVTPPVPARTAFILGVTASLRWPTQVFSMTSDTSSACAPLPWHTLTCPVSSTSPSTMKFQSPHSSTRLWNLLYWCPSC